MNLLYKWWEAFWHFQYPYQHLLPDSADSQTNRCQAWLQLAPMCTHVCSHMSDLPLVLTHIMLLYCFLIIYIRCRQQWPCLVLHYTKVYLLLMLVHDVVLFFIQLVQFLSQPTTAILDVLWGGAIERAVNNTLLNILQSVTYILYMYTDYT